MHPQRLKTFTDTLTKTRNDESPNKTLYKKQNCHFHCNHRVLRSQNKMFLHLCISYCKKSKLYTDSEVQRLLSQEAVVEKWRKKNIGSIFLCVRVRRQNREHWIQDCKYEKLFTKYSLQIENATLCSCCTRIEVLLRCWVVLIGIVSRHSTYCIM